MKSLLATAGDMGLISGLRPEIPYAAGRLSPRATATEPVLCNKRRHHNEKPSYRSKEENPSLQLEKSLCTATEPPRILEANPRSRSEKLGSN